MRSTLIYLVAVMVVALGLLGGPSSGWSAYYGDYLGSISGGGLNQPAKAAVDAADGSIYVADAGNKAIKKYNSDGSVATGFSITMTGTPVGIAVSGNYLYVGDDTNDCVWIYNKSTGALTDLSGTGTSHKLGGASGTALKMPNTITVAPSGHIFVVDGDRDKVYIYNSTGTANSSFGASGSTTSSGTTIYVYYPIGLAMADSTEASGIVTQKFFLGDQGNNRVQKLSYSYNEYTGAITTAPTFVMNIGTGSGDNFGKFLRISDVACDNHFNRLFVLDSLQMVTQIFDYNNVLYTNSSNPCKTSSNYVALNYCTSSVSGYLNVPTGLAISATGQKIYVANNQGADLRVFNTQGGMPTCLPASQISPSN